MNNFNHNINHQRIQVQKVKVSSSSQIAANSTFNDTGLTLNGKSSLRKFINKYMRYSP